MYDVLDISFYIVNYHYDNNTPITNRKLQQVLYLTKIYYFELRKKVLFKDSFESWAYGPTCTRVYNYFGRYGAHDIPRRTNIERYSLKTGDFYQQKWTFKLKEKDKKVINMILDTTLDVTENELYEVIENINNDKRDFNKIKTIFENALKNKGVFQ